MYLEKLKFFSNSPFPRCSYLIFSVILVTSVQKVRPEDFVYGTDVSSQEGCNSDDPGNMQMQALRHQLMQILTSPQLNENFALPNYDLLSDGKQYESTMFNSKHSPSQSRLSHLPYSNRNLADLLKFETSPYRTMLKRSIATLAKNGQLPTLQSPEDIPEEIIEEEEEKRGIETLARSGGVHQYLKKSLEALARNGELHNTNKNNYANYKRNIQYVMKNKETQEGKRNMAALARSRNLPDYDRSEPKRNIGTIARDWALPNHSTAWHKGSDDKRNVAALLRQDSYLHSVNRNSGLDPYPTPESEEVHHYDAKRNLAALKAGMRINKRDVKSATGTKEESESLNKLKTKDSNRHKRQADEYFTENAEDYNPILQKSNSFDYDELVKALSGDYFSNQKRFLGNIPLQRMTELGKISMLGQPAMSNATPTSPTYRRRQYLLSRTLPDEAE